MFSKCVVVWQPSLATTMRRCDDARAKMVHNQTHEKAVERKRESRVASILAIVRGIASNRIIARVDYLLTHIVAN